MTCMHVCKITRCCRGIGLESSILFASEGANVLLVDINLLAAEHVAGMIAEEWPALKVLATKADIGREADVKAAVDLAVEKFGRLDVMVCISFFCDYNIRSAYMRPT